MTQLDFHNEWLVRRERHWQRHSYHGYRLLVGIKFLIRQVRFRLFNNISMQGSQWPLHSYFRNKLPFVSFICIILITWIPLTQTKPIAPKFTPAKEGRYNSYCAYLTIAGIQGFCSRNTDLLGVVFQISYWIVIIHICIDTKLTIMCYETLDIASTEQRWSVFLFFIWNYVIADIKT